jgi:hypothetical protein
MESCQGITSIIDIDRNSAQSLYSPNKQWQDQRIDAAKSG